ERAASDERDRAVAAEELTRAALAGETAAKSQARRALDALVDDVILTVFAARATLGEAEQRFLRRVAGFYEEFTGDAGQTAEARHLRAGGYLKLAQIYEHLGRHEDAEAAALSSVTLLEKLTAQFPTNAKY